MKRKKVVVLLGSVTLLAVSMVAVGVGPAAAYSERAGVVVRDHFVQKLPVINRSIEISKVQDASGAISLVAKDEKGGVVDLAALEKAERAASDAAYGKLDPDLALSMQTTAGGQAAPVAIWVDTPAVSVNRGRSVAEQLQAVDVATTPTKDAVVAAVQKVQGTNVRAAQYGPVVFADLTPVQVRSLTNRGDIVAIYPQTQYRLFNDDATSTERAYLTWSAGNLGAGASSKPVIHEPDGVSDYNPYLSNATHPVVFWCSSVSAACPVGKSIVSAGDHASEVAGVISSTHPLDRGEAPNAQIIFSANSQDFSDANLVAAYEWARGNGGDPVNMSWGSTCPDGNQNFMSRYIDWAGRYLYSTFTISSGNTNGCASRDLQVSSPGVAWSAITVGAFRDNNDAFWSGDAMSTFSRYQNPDFAPGMQKPEVVAVGEDRTTTNSSGITASGVSGTSFSAPAIAGVVTQMLARRPSQNIWPETNKAAILVSAQHDIVGGFAAQDQDGVGGVVSNIADTVYRNSQFSNGFGDASPGSFPQNRVVNFTKGQTVRAAISWDAMPTGTTTDVLGADIDLCVKRNDTNAIVACSASVQNAWEAVQFVAPVTGAYTITSSLFSSVAGWPGTYIGTAWGVNSVASICSGQVTVPATGASYTNVSTANGPTFIDNYTGWATPQTGRERYFKLALTAPKDITFTDNAANLDLHIVRLSACSGSAATVTTLANGSNSAFLDNAPAGTYYLVLDGANGAVGSANVGVAVTGP